MTGVEVIKGLDRDGLLEIVEGAGKVFFRERRAGYSKELVADGCYLVFGWPDIRSLGEARRAGRRWEAIFSNTVSDHPTLHAACCHLVELWRLAGEVVG